MQADLFSQRERALKTEAALTEAQTRTHQLSEAIEQTRQDKGEVEQRTRQEMAQAEQQVVELKAVEGQLEAEVVRLQLQLEGVQGQLQVSALRREQLACACCPVLCICMVFCFCLCPFFCSGLGTHPSFAYV